MSFLQVQLKGGVETCKLPFTILVSPPFAITYHSLRKMVKPGWNLVITKKISILLDRQFSLDILGAGVYPQQQNLIAAVGCFHYLGWRMLVNLPFGTSYGCVDYSCKSWTWWWLLAGIPGCGGLGCPNNG